MVSKVTKKTPTKPSPTKPRRRRPRNSPLKSFASAALRSCRRRLVKIFALFNTPNKAHSIPFRRFSSVFTEDEQETSPTGLKPLPPPTHPEKRTLFLDLDETLIHSQTGSPPPNYHFTVHPTIDGKTLTFYVLKRPGVDELLQRAAEAFEVVVFTAGIEAYASLVLDRLDPGRELISHRLYRDSCKAVEGGKYVKDLAGTGRELGRAVIVDDNPNAYSLQQENALPVAAFRDDLGDVELKRVMEFLEFALLFDDAREAVASFLSRRPGFGKVE